MLIPRRYARIAMGARSYRLLVLVSAVALFYLLFPRLYRFVDYVRQTNPFSGQDKIQQTFDATEQELACLYGNGHSSNDAGGTSISADGAAPIPNKVHFIFGLKNPLQDKSAGRFDLLSYLAVRSAIVSLSPDAVFLHYTYLSEPQSSDPAADPLTNPYIKRLSRHLTLVHHALAADEGRTQFAHLSDTMRLRFLHEQGGIYMDIDAFALRSFDSLRNPPAGRDIVLGHEGGNRWGLCNAVIAARANSSFVARWLESYDTVDFSKEWNYHSVLLPKEMAGQYPAEVCALAPDAFFWPTWTWNHIEWMHEPMGREEADHWREEIRKNGGSLFKNQVAYHAWNQMAWDRHLKKLTPRVIREKDTRFNLLMRRFLEDDLY